MNSLALLIWTIAAADGPPQTYSDSVMHFTLKVPDGWALLSPQELAEVDEGHAKEHGAAPTKTDARMRPARLKPGALPFIAVSHLQCTPPTLETMRDGLSGVIDTRRNAVMFTKDKQANGMAVTQIGAVFSASAGTVNLMLLCPKAEIETYRPILEAVLDSASFELGFGFQEGPEPAVATRNFWLLAGAVVLVVAVYLYRRQRAG
jgi:hypothetical protein